MKRHTKMIVARDRQKVRCETNGNTVKGTYIVYRGSDVCERTKVRKRLQGAE